MRTLGCLQGVDLQFLRRNITHHNLFPLGPNLRNPISLTNFTLNFSGWDIIDENLQSLAENIQQSTTLVQIKLYFEGCEEITSTGVNHLTYCLRDLDPVNPLEVIILDFSNCESLDYEELDLESYYFEHLEHLERIGIHFEGCGFPDEFLENLQEDFERVLEGVQVFIA